MADDSFFLYGMGERPEALTLGSLVLEKYWQPMNARHYTHELLRYYSVDLALALLLSSPYWT